MITIIEPVEKGAYVYHNGFYICGITFVPDEHLESQFDKIIIPTEIGIEFVQGNMSHDKWFVWNGKLYNNDVTKIEEGLELNLIDEKYVPIEDNNKSKNLWLSIKVYPNTQHVTFKLTSLITAFKYSEETISFVFTEKNDPSTPLYFLDVPTQELFENHEYDCILPITLDKRLDVYTKRLFPNYGVEYPKIIVKEDGEEVWENDEVVLSLPKSHFVDLKIFDSNPITRGLQAALDRRAGIITFSLVGDNIETYNRSVSFLRLLFSMPKDPSLLLYTKTILIEELQKTPIEVSLPDNLIGIKFDIWSPMIYKNCSLVETKHDLKIFDSNPIVSGLQASLDKHTDAITFSLVGNNIETYNNSSVSSLRLLFSSPKDPSLLLYTKTILIEELQKSISIPLPNRLIGTKFDIWSPMIYKNCNFIETIYDKFEKELVVYKGTNIQAVVDKPNKTINFSIVGDDSVKNYVCPKKKLTIYFTKPDSEWDVFHTELISFEELKRNTVTIMLPKILIENHFHLRIEPGLFKKAYHLERECLK
jgi:hypothetical protein